MSKLQFETLSIHGGIDKENETTSRAVPLHRTTAYNFRDTRQAADLFGLKELGFIYSRLQNPTQDVLEKRVAALEGGGAALALSSGTSAVFYAIINICTAGTEIVASSHLYGGTYTMFDNILPQFGITVRFADPGDPRDFRSKINDKTRAVFLETIGNPGLSVPDFRAISEIAHNEGIPLIVDSTFTTPYLFRPLENGADIVVHSLTKWMGGHGTGIGGIVIDSGRFDWKNGKFPTLTEADESYHDIRYAYDLGDLNHLAYILRMRLVPLRNLGACISPDNAWIFLQGLETLGLRMERHCENAVKAARYLEEHPRVDWVRYPGLSSHPHYKTASKYFSNGFGGMVVFGIKGGSQAGEKFINSLKLFSHVANVGDAKSLAIHPASTTHSQLSEAQQKSAGLNPEMVRLSIGIEHIDDILADMEQALAAASR